MAVDYTALWDEIYAMLAADSTLQTLLGGSERIYRQYPPTLPDMSSSSSILILGDVDSSTIRYGVDEGMMFVSAWSSVQKRPVLVSDRVSALMDGYDPTVAWCQYITRSDRGAVSFDATSQLYFLTDTYLVPHRRM